MSLCYFSSDREWESCRPLITELRQTPGMTLKKIQAHMESHCGLRATEKMYKNKFEKWGLGKNNRRRDIEAILRRKAQRDAAGKRTHFFLRGRLVRLADVDRYAKRNKISLDNLQPIEENESDDLKDLICCTPPPESSMLHFECYRETEKFFHSFFIFTLAEFEELRKTPNSRIDAILQPAYESSKATMKIFTPLWKGARYYRLGKVDLAGKHWRQGFAELDKSIKDSQPDFMLELLLATRNLSEAGCPEIGVMLIKHASQIANAQLVANHPRLLAYSSIAAFEECDIQTILVLAGKLYRRAIVERYEKSFALMWHSRLWLDNLQPRLGDHATSTEFQSLLLEMENPLGKSHIEVLTVLLCFGIALIRMSLYEEAVVLFLDSLDRSTNSGPQIIFLAFYGLLRLGDALRKAGKVGAARTTLTRALSTFQRSQLEVLVCKIFLAQVYNTLKLIAQETQRGDEAIEWGAKSAELTEYVRGYELAEGKDPASCE